MPQPNRNLRHSLKSLVPIWLSDRPGFNVGFAVLFVIALLADLFVEAMLEGFKAPQPGRGDPSALPYIGASRGLIRGLSETDDAYATRLQAWLDFWASQVGREQTLAQYLQLYLGPGASGALPVVRAITRSGRFVTANADGTVTVAFDATWSAKWDGSEVQPQFVSRQGYWSDLWAVVYLPPADGRYAPYNSFHDTDWVANWAKKNGTGIGHRLPLAVGDGLRQVIDICKGAHTYVVALIWSYSNSFFIPGSLGTVPPGDWGNCSDWDGSNHQFPGRGSQTFGVAPYVRFMTPFAGA